MSGEKTVEFIFDVGSPNAYLAYHALPGVLAPYNASIQIVPCLLGGIFKATGNESPMDAFAGVKGKLEYQALETRRFIARHDLHSFRMNPHFPMNTLHLMRGMIAAEDAGVKTDYTQAVLAGMWERELKMDDPTVLADVLTDTGLDAQALMEATQDPGVKQRLIDNTQAAVDRGVFGVPTFFVGKEMFFGKDRIDALTDYL